METKKGNEAKPTNRKERTKIIHAYILGCIQSEGYDIELHNDKERIKFLLDCFQNEKMKHNKEHYRNEHEAFTDWCRGLPSCFGIDFTNFDILELGRKWGILPIDASERQEDNFIEQYWNTLYMNVKAIEREVNRLPKLTIYDIARLTQETSPFYFTRDTLRFFHQRMSDFRVYKQKDGKYLINAPMKDSTGRIVGTSQRIFNPITNQLEHV